MSEPRTQRRDGENVQKLHYYLLFMVIPTLLEQNWVDKKNMICMETRFILLSH